MQLELTDAIDDQPMAPRLGGAVGAGVEQPVQHGEKDGAFDIELEFPLAGQFANHAPATGLLPQPFEGECRAELAGHHFGGLAPPEKADNCVGTPAKCGRTDFHTWMR